MAVTYANQIENHRGVYFECTGDGSTTALTVSHGRSIFNGCTATAFVVTAPSGTFEKHSGKGGFTFPQTGTAKTISSVTVSKTSVTINTSTAVANATKAYCVVIFDQPSPVN